MRYALNHLVYQPRDKRDLMNLWNADFIGAVDDAEGIQEPDRHTNDDDHVEDFLN